MRYTPINGFTKARIIETIQTRIKGKPAYNEKSGVQFPTCLYCTVDGNHCAVGAFIPDEHPASDEVMSVGGLLDKHPDLEKILPLKLFELEALQGIHDKYARRATVTGAPNPLFNQDPRPELIAWINENVKD